ncbi:hypothetical protein KALB_440 [Kutzneria albida DSM 43870]|uniref:HTH cro/C1-type domain-containing protein n=2 Tax=Kutzneria TaxID=43356 RepID=W5VZ15_9PSEU|nr:hypothetical protein KALB_440 [Kutzneria albida DSM 43870]
MTGSRVEHSVVRRENTLVSVGLKGQDMRETGAAAIRLGAELRRLRLERGLSLRAMAKRVGMSAHSGLVDYERGNRIPPHDLLTSYLRELRPTDQKLVSLHRLAMSERADLRAGIAPEPPVSPIVVSPAPPRVLRVTATVLGHVARTLQGVAERITRLP